MNIPKFEDVKKPLVEYISFLMNVRDGYVSENETPESLDRKRKELHDKVCKAFGIGLNQRHLAYIHAEYIEADASPEQVAWSYWTSIVDMMTERTYNEIHTRYHAKVCIDGIIEYWNQKFDEMKEYCSRIFDAFEKDRDEFNDRIKAKVEDAYGKGLLCFVSFKHDYNGAVSNIRYYLKIMADFAKYPIEAYIEATVKEYLEEPRRIIKENLNLMAAQAAWCNMYHQKFVNNQTKYKFKED